MRAAEAAALPAGLELSYGLPSEQLRFRCQSPLSPQLDGFRILTKTAAERNARQGARGNQSSAATRQERSITVWLLINGRQMIKSIHPAAPCGITLVVQVIMVALCCTGDPSSLTLGKSKTSRCHRSRRSARRWLRSVSTAPSACMLAQAGPQVAWGCAAARPRACAHIRGTRDIRWRARLRTWCGH